MNLFVPTAINGGWNPSSLPPPFPAVAAVSGLSVSELPDGNEGLRAEHAVVKTLYSRARRIGLDETSWVLRRPSEDSSLDRLMVVVAALLV